jgi:hypothetical protein
MRPLSIQIRAAARNRLRESAPPIRSGRTRRRWHQAGHLRRKASQAALDARGARPRDNRTSHRIRLAGGAQCSGVRTPADQREAALIAAVVSFPTERPRIEIAPEGGWIVLRGDHGWLAGDRQQALREFSDLDRIERRGRA